MSTVLIVSEDTAQCVRILLLREHTPSVQGYTLPVMCIANRVKFVFSPDVILCG